MLLNLGKILLGLLVFWLWMVFARNYYICEVKGLCKQEQIQNDSATLAQLTNSLEVLADGFVVFEGYPEFHFDHSSTSPIYGRRHLHLLEGLADKLKRQSQARLKIEAVYLPSETETKVERYQNLAVARAMAIADKLIYEYNVNPQQLMTLGVLRQDTSLKAPVSLELMGYLPTGTAAMEKEVEHFAKQFESSLMRVTYDSRMALLRDPEARFKLAPPIFNEYVDKLKEYLADKEDVKILLIGHTDSKLSAKEAQEEAKAFAENMKTYLSRRGILNEMKVESRGKEEKLAEDMMPDNQLNKYLAAKNRRVEILLVDVK
jgi:hypothetical protein